MSWDRAKVAEALEATLEPLSVKVHLRPPEVLNPMCVVVSRPMTVTYATFAFGIDEATLPLIIVGGVETEDAIESIKGEARTLIAADPTLAGTVASAVCSEERNWRNVTGAGGVQLLLVELVLTIEM